MRGLRDDTHLILDGAVRIYRRARSTRWQAAFSLHGRLLRFSTGKRDLREAKEAALDAYMESRLRDMSGTALVSLSFAEVARAAVERMKRSPRSESERRDCEKYMTCIERHLIPLFGEIGIGSIDIRGISGLRTRSRERRGEEYGISEPGLHYAALKLVFDGAASAGPDDIGEIRDNSKRGARKGGYQRRRNDAGASGGNHIKDSSEFSSQKRQSSVKSINSLARGLQILQLIQVSNALTLQDMHRISGVPKASLLRILKTLREQGIIWQRIVDGAYVASYSLSELASRLDRESRLAEIASPILARLTEDVKWPSVLAVPRLTHMEVRETNAPRAFFDHISLGPVGFQINYLRSATGCVYLAFCEPPRREAILDRLKKSGRKGDNLAHSSETVQRILSEARTHGYALRDHDFGGHFDEDRRISDDKRDSLGVAIRVGASVPGSINLTWTKRALDRKDAVRMFAHKVIRASEEIAEGLAREHGGSPRETY